MAFGFHIGDRPIGRDAPPYVIAEMSANHAGSYEEAVELIRIAASRGADAVKLQTYTADTMTIDVDSELMTIGEGSLWGGRSLHELYQEAHTPWEWQPDLRAVALEYGIELFSSAFDVTAVEFLESMDVPAHKVASFEIVDLELIAAMASTGKPLIISTGMSTMDEVELAFDTALSNGASEIALLKCTSGYPASPKDMNLSAIPMLREKFSCEVGLSDHTLGSFIPVAAIGLGATIVEKHFVRSRSVNSADSQFSLEPDDLGLMIRGIREAHEALGAPRLGPSDHEKRSMVFRRSLFAVEDIDAGAQLTRDNVRSIRPGFGLAPRHLPEVLGRTASRRIPRGTPLDWGMINRGPQPS